MQGKEKETVTERLGPILRKLIAFGKELNTEIKKDRVSGLAAEQAYYYMLALFPAMILLLSVIPYLSLSSDDIITLMREFMPGETVSLFEENIVELVENKSGGLLTFGILATLWSASNGLNAFIHSMNIAFDVEESRNFIMARILSIVLTICVVFAFLVVLALPVFGHLIFDFVNKIVPMPDGTETIFNIVRWLLALAVVIIVLSFMYYAAPNKHYPFKEVIPGAAIATILWLTLSVGFSFYVSNFADYSSTYGSLGSVIILMLWLYLTGFTFLIGGEINAILHKRKAAPKQKRKLLPAKHSDRPAETVNR